jgi:putative transposase
MIEWIHDEVLQVLSDAQWRTIEPHLPGQWSDRGVTAKDTRLFVEGVLWIARENRSWRSLPKVYGPWNSAYRRFNRWSAKGAWSDVFRLLHREPGFEYRIEDNRIVWRDRLPDRTRKRLVIRSRQRHTGV